MTKPSQKIVKRKVKHVFTTEETAGLHCEFTTAYNAKNAVESEFDSVKASYKSKVSEAEARMAGLNAMLQAGFEHRDKDCVVILDIPEGKKLFYLTADFLEDGSLKPLAEPVITEAVTDEDRQQELIEAEAKFEDKKEISLFDPAGFDSGVMVIGRLGAKWFSALRVKIGDKQISERLDSEQTCSKKRFDQIKRTLNYFGVWLDEQLGREVAKGFKNAIELVKAAEEGKEE